MIGDKIIDKLVEDNGEIKISFCPYKWEMWDSMKSVYHSALSHGLDADICPVPYFSKNPDGNFLKWESDPDDYKLPDSEWIVTHNPFDNCNRITSVHSAFYSDNLKRLGYKVIYIPYHTGRTMPHVIKMPVVRNSDYVFAVDKEDAKAFLSVYPDKKVFSYGSPKKDLLNAKPHGHRTILCASLMPVIEHPLERIETYKRFLKEGVIFRPHPLTEQGLAAMNPDYVDAWQRFIYSLPEVDTEPEAQRTLAKCSYLYTDSPSMVELWRETGLEYEWI